MKTALKISKKWQIFFRCLFYMIVNVICAYMTLCGTLRGGATFVILECLIFVIDELSRIRHLIGFWNKEQFNNQSNFVFDIRQNHSGSGTK